MFEMCIIHVLFMGIMEDQCANQLYWAPRREQQSHVHLEIGWYHFLKSGLALPSGGKK